MFARLRRSFGRVDVDGEESREKQTKPESNDGHRTWSCGMWKAYRQTSSPETVLNKVQANEEEERLNRELELTTKERNELTDRLLYVTGGSMNKSNLHSRLLMDQACMKKKLVTLKQECKELQRYLFELNPNDEDEQEKTSNLQTQQNLVSETTGDME
ncbi:uncharacterized protein LOC134483310 isoform X1 [Rattus norvegicus]|uniref:uncharacterized protein LOC134483310 isoform X1 n=1 Tax=Rattus norvegicus TaxID=10116 RepID=UPI002FD83CE1